VDADYFYDTLAPYGDWVEVAPYGRCWVPHGVAVGWRPYTTGHWVNTDDGMYWVADEDWGWACFHYGRWAWTVQFGWCWMPGTVWAPNWCAWRWGDEWCAWAPLPPSARFSFQLGLSVGDVDLDAVIEPSWWCCCHPSFILEPKIRVRIVPFSRNVTILHVTRNVTRITIRDHHVVADSIREDRLERALGHRVEPRRLVDADSPVHADRHGQIGDQLRIYRPEHHGEVVRVPGAARPAPKLMPSQEVRRRFDEHASGYDKYLQSQRQEMERRHQQELARPPRGVRPEDIGRRQEEERRVFDEYARRQREELQRGRQEQGDKGGGEERAPQGRGGQGRGPQG
jgi:hypothetical protein